MPVCVGEVINTPKELIDRMQGGVYTFVQPDASVIGGISSVMEIFDAALDIDMDVVVHAWGGASAIMANYHVAFAGGGSLVEYPMLNFPLTTKMLNFWEKDFEKSIDKHKNYLQVNLENQNTILTRIYNFIPFCPFFY